MRGERWSKVKVIYAQASELPRGARDGFLDEACDGDAALRGEVETLLRSGDESEAFLIPPTRSPVAGVDPADERAPHSRIGPYEVVRRLGAGGMGTVYLAERADGQVRTQVAVKVVKRGMDTEQILLRFANERQALAELNHRYIASFLDAGMTEDGLPYLIMEYVDGERIDRFCAARRLDVRRRLELFLKVCDAVSHAHRNLFIHRDLKPSNILITADGEPKLLDFGLAKVLTPGVQDATRSVTNTEQRFLTPDYASPEQITGGHMRTTSDVYSLGVLLYTLLTGRPPHRFRGLPTREIERVLAMGSAPAASALALSQRADDASPEGERFAAFLRGWPASEGTAERLSKALRGDLDNILLKAVHADPERRYGSVEQLREDIGRHLSGLPVLARKDTVAYRAGKFIRRHRSMVAAASVVFALLVGGGTAVAWQAKVAAEARERSIKAQLKESALQGWLLSMLTTADPGAGDSGMTGDIFFERLRTRIDRGLSAEPEIDAQLLEQIGRIYYTHGRYEEAAGILRRAVGVRQTIAGSSRSAAMGSALHLLGAVLTEAGAHEEANNALRAALSIRLELYGDRDLRVAGVLDNLTLLDTWRGDYGQAREWFDRSEWIYSQNLADYDLHMLSQSTSVASIMIERGDLGEARAVHNEAVERVRERLGEGDEYVAGLLLVDAKIKRGLGDLEGSRAAHEELLARLTRLHGARDHPDVAAACASAAETLALLGEHERAIRLYDRALAMQRLLHGENHPITARTAEGLERALRLADG